MFLLIYSLIVFFEIIHYIICVIFLLENTWSSFYFLKRYFNYTSMSPQFISKKLGKQDFQVSFSLLLVLFLLTSFTPIFFC